MRKLRFPSQLNWLTDILKCQHSLQVDFCLWFSLNCSCFLCYSVRMTELRHCVQPWLEPWCCSQHMHIIKSTTSSKTNTFCKATLKPVIHKDRALVRQGHTGSLGWPLTNPETANTGIARERTRLVLSHFISTSVSGVVNQLQKLIQPKVDHISWRAALE